MANDFELIKKIISDEELAQAACDALTLSLFEGPQPLSEYNDEELDGEYTFSEDGSVFAEDGAGGFYILLEDGSIGYANPAEDECGRPAENMREFLELMLNCAYTWQNYMERRFIDKPELVGNYVESWEEKGRKQFSNAFGNKYPPYEELAKKISERFDLRLSEDISKDVLPKLYGAMTRDPEFAVTMDEDEVLKQLGKYGV